jgi:ribosomal protein S18 acetylase RimI-like enzyme
MNIEPLAPTTLNQAIAVANRVFPHQGLTEKASYAFRLSLISGWLPRIILRSVNIIEVSYWVAVEDRRVLGTTGLYGYAQDFYEAYWLGWTCVLPEARESGIGGKLVDHAIAQAQQSDKSFLRLYTSTQPNEAVAQTLYENRGLKIVKEETLFGTPYKKIYRELNLRT